MGDLDFLRIVLLQHTYCIRLMRMTAQLDPYQRSRPHVRHFNPPTPQYDRSSGIHSTFVFIFYYFSFLEKCLEVSQFSLLIALHIGCEQVLQCVA